MADDDRFDDLSDSGEPDFPLPDGVSKEIVVEAGTSQWLKPKTGDEVTIHYVAKMSLSSSNESDFTEFDSSRSREPFSFTLGNGDVVKGLELGIPTMRKGELAKFTVRPEFGYGSAGATGVPPGVAVGAGRPLLKPSDVLQQIWGIVRNH